MKKKREIDLESCVTCLDCEGLMVNISIPSKQPKWKCVSCGTVMWLEDEETTWTGQDSMMHEFTFSTKPRKEVKE